MVDAGDSKSPAARRAGSIPAPGTSGPWLLLKVCPHRPFVSKICGYLMNDDEFSGFVSSGKKMRVSVSEHTGNAKNPKNIVTSHEEETQEKVRSFEDKEGEFDPLAHNTAPEQNLRLDKFVTKPVKGDKAQNAPSDKTPLENVQSVNQAPAQTNKQAISQSPADSSNKQSANTGATKDNLQSVTSNASVDNLQGIPTDTQSDNHQSISSDSLKENQQGIPTTKVEDNIQGIASDKLQDNLQGIGNDRLQDNLQGIPTETFEENLQELPSTQPASSNTQSIPTGNVETNIQGIHSSPVNDNLQDIAIDRPTDNLQAIPTAQRDAVKPATIAKDPISTNDAGIAKENIQERNALVEKEQVKTNTASIPKDTHHETRQALDKDSFEDRGASVTKKPLEDNLQAAPSVAPIGDNLQAVDHTVIADHFEVLPTDVRPLEESKKTANKPITSKVAPTAPSVVAPINKAAPSKQSTNPQRNSLASAISPAEAKKIAIAHQAQMEAFHGRLAGIKHNVDELNHKLDDLENKS